MIANKRYGFKELNNTRRILLKAGNLILFVKNINRKQVLCSILRFSPILNKNTQNKQISLKNYLLKVDCVNYLQLLTASCFNELIQLNLNLTIHHPPIISFTPKINPKFTR